MLRVGHPAHPIPIHPFHTERHVRQFSLSIVVSLLRTAVSSMLAFLSSTLDGPVGRYRPEDHYMRGPGPKWREKNFLDRASAGRI
jgi:hypothetical protein